MAYHYPLNRPYISAYDAPIDYSAQRAPPAPGYYAPPVAPPAAPMPPQSDHERMASLLERENASLRQELKSSRDKTAETLTELTRCRDELRQASANVEELQREVARARDAVGRSENLKLAEAQAEVALLRQEIRSRDSHIAAQADQLRAESERLRGCSEQLEQSRRELEDLRSKLKIAGDRAEGVQAQASRKDELIKLLETDIAHKQQRLEQSERLVLGLQAQLGDKEHGLQRWQSEAEARSKTASELDAQLKKFDAMRVEYEQRLERFRGAYNELCDIMGASEMQRQTLSAGAKLREVLAGESKVRAELAEVRQHSELKQYEASTQAMTLDHMKSELARLGDMLRAKDTELNAVREELLARTRDLRNLAMTHTSMERDERSRGDHVARLQALLEQKEQQLAERDKASQAHAAREQQALYEARNEALRMQTEHSRAATALQQRIQELEQSSRVDAEYVEAARRIGRLLCVDPTTAPATHAQAVLAAVERLAREASESARGFNATRSLGSSLASGGLGASLTGPLAATAAPSAGRAEEDWLRSQLLESEQRFVKAQVRHDALLRDLAREMHLPDVRDPDAILEEVTRLVKSKTGKTMVPAPPATPPTRPRPGTARVGGAHDKGDVQRQLQSALQTIESQDKWISHLNARLESTGLGAPATASAAGLELKQLREETAALRAQLASRGPGGTVDELHTRLQAHIDFRNALLRTLQMGPSATNEAILRRIETLTAEALRPQPGALATHGTGAAGSVYASLTGFPYAAASHK